MTGVFDERILPPPLANLVATFSHWVESEIGAIGRADAVGEPVFHYTTGMGLEGILSSGSIRLTDLGEARSTDNRLRIACREGPFASFAVTSSAASDFTLPLSLRRYQVWT
jgi:hypothetical protein